MSKFTDFLGVYMEGEQAEEYKRRKAEEQEKEAHAGDKRYTKSYTSADSVKDIAKTGMSSAKEAEKKYGKFASKGISAGTEDSGDISIGYTPGQKMTKNNPNYGIKHPVKTAKDSMDDYRRAKQAQKMADEHNQKTGGTMYNSERLRAVDAANRHLRRHPEVRAETAFSKYLNSFFEDAEEIKEIEDEVDTKDANATEQDRAKDAEFADPGTKGDAEDILKENNVKFI